MKYFKLSKNADDKVEIVPILKPHPFTIQGISLVAHKEGKEWRSTEVTTGLILEYNAMRKEEVIKKSEELISRIGATKINTLIKEAYNRNKEEIEKYMTPQIRQIISNVVEL